ncbi:MAG: hypothetical protein ACXADB_14170 [Candidatus Hermodarchaeia archaeon]|jgi:chaperonin GroES
MVNFPHRPAGWRILLEVIEVDEKTEGGIILPGMTKEAAQHATVLAKVTSIGDMAFEREDMRGHGPWCKVRDYVLIAKFAGYKYIIQGKEYKVINDDEIIMVTEKPEEIERGI